MKRKLKLFFALFFVGVGFLAAQTQVRGMVVDETGEPVIGATIQIKGTSQGTATDADGRFTLSAPADGMLVISYIGMQTQEVPVGANVSVVLTASTELLDEVLVVAYGTSRRSAVTGAISTVDVSQIEKRPVSSVISVLEGTGTGIQVNSTYGQPGRDADIRIRGFGSVTGSNTPLYVLDGVPFGGNISDLNANDIENISVLKDATSAALYGNRASNGVILITTKKGKSERVRIRMSTNQGVYTRGLAEYDRVNADDFMEVMWQGYRNQLVSNGRTPEEAGQTASGTLVSDILLYNVYNKPGDQLFDANGKLLSDASIRSGYANDLNWYKPIERKGYRQEYNLSGEGATEKNNFFFSVGYLGEQGYIINSGFDRLTARANINLTPNKWFKTGISVSGSHQNADYTNGDANASASFTNPFMYARNIAPIYPVHLHNMENGEYLLDENENKQYDGGSEYGRPQYPSRHVVWEMELDRDNSIRNTINSILYADIRFLNDFVFTLKGDMNLRNNERRAYNNATIGDGAGNNGRSSRNIYRYKNYTFQQQLNWNRTFNGLHFVDALVGHENYSYNYSYLYGYKTTEIFPGAIEMQNFTAITSLYDYQHNYRTESYLGRVRYSYDEKYHADASYRRDGSSRFHPDHRWGNFWSMGVNWIASKEDFIKEIDWINALKVRASYGEVGNDESVSYYGYMALYSMAQNANKGAAYKTQNEASNIKWESAASFSAAVEATLFKRLDLSLEYFDKRTNDLLFDVYMPLSAGATSTSAAEATITKNLGSVSNRGVEFTIDYSILQSKEWEWKIGGNATWLKNKILTLPEQNRENGIISSTKKYMEGHGIYDYWLYQFAGVDRLTGNALYLPNLEDYFINRGGDNKLGDGSDEIPGEHLVKIGEEYYTKNPTFGKRDWSGSVIPKVYGALNTSLSYKNFTLTGLATYAIGGKTIDYSYQSLMSASGSPHALHKDILNSWSSPEGITENSPNRIDPNGIPVVDFARSNFNNATSSRFLTDGSYFVVKNISLSYLFPRQLIRKIDFESIRLNASVENLATFTKRKGMNPQQSFAGTSDNVMVTPRVFTVGVSFQF